MPDETLLNVKQIAHTFNLKTDQVYDLIRRTDIPHFRLTDNGIRFRWSEVSSWLEGRRVVRRMRR